MQNERPRLAAPPHHPARTIAAIAVAIVVTLIAAGCSGTKKDLTDNSTADSVATSSGVVATTTTESTESTQPATTTTVLPTTTTEAPTTTTTIPLVTEGAVVLVANASAVPGAAGRQTQSLSDHGFHVLEATNAAGNEASLDATKVYFYPDGEAVATSIATAMGGVPVARMPTPAPIVDATAGLHEATVLVMLGKDLADQPLPGL